MRFRDRMRDHTFVLRLGMAFLLIGNVSHFLVHPASRFGQDAFDGVYGLLTGLAIACLLLSLRREERRPS